MAFAAPIKTSAGITLPFDLKEASVEAASMTTAIVAHILRGIDCMSYKVSTGFAVGSSKKLDLESDKWWLLISFDTPKNAKPTWEEDIIRDLMSRLGLPVSEACRPIDRASTKLQAQDGEKSSRMARIKSKIRTMQQTSRLNTLKSRLDSLTLHHEKTVRVYDDIPFLLSYGAHDADFAIFDELCRHLQAGGETRLCGFAFTLRELQTWDRIDERLDRVSSLFCIVVLKVATFSPYSDHSCSGVEWRSASISQYRKCSVHTFSSIAM
ncbi:hypothetical protein BDV11DRAFT_215564 [Aspergillus similis]